MAPGVAPRDASHGYATSYPNMDVLDASAAWLARPHTLIALIAAMVALIAVALRNETDDAFGVSNVALGITVSSASFLLFSVLHFHDGPFQRPHPALWRLVKGLSILYLMFLTFLFVQPTSDARQLFKLIDPQLGVELPEKDYAADCRLYTPDHPESTFFNLKEALLDEFVIAHALGWVGKMILIRDYKLAWVLSIVFEILEYSLEHMLTNFKECWWDHLILDVIVCNFLGMAIGAWFVNYMSIKKYDWAGDQFRGFRGKVKRGVLQFTPKEFSVFDWGVFTSFRRFVGVIIMLCVFEINELNAFFLKTTLWIPANHYLNVVRLLLWWLIAGPAMREWYQYCVDDSTRKIGAQTWIGAALICTESLCCYKFGQGMFPTPAPPVVFWGWTLAAVGLVVFTIVYFGLGWRPKRLSIPQGEEESSHQKAD